MDLNFRNKSEEYVVILYVIIGICVAIYVYIRVGNFLVALGCGTFWPILVLYYTIYELIIYFWHEIVVYFRGY